MAKRRGRKRKRLASGVRQLPWREAVNPYAPMEVLSNDQVEAIHFASLKLLQEIGVRVLQGEARSLLCEAGADVNESAQIVRFDPMFIEEKVNLAPSEFTLHARNPDRDVKIGGRSIVFTSVGGPAFCNDLDRGRRTGTYKEQCDYLRLVQSLNIVHQEGGGPFEAMDLHPDTRHLDLYLAQSRLLDKTWQPQALGRERAEDAIEMACIALGVDRGELARRPALQSIINTNTPLQFDIPMAEGTIAMARAGQSVCVTPFSLAGAMGPATLAGTLTLQNAEALMGIAFTQIVNPGTPSVYGAFTSNVDMRSGSPAFGTPEYTKAAHASGQLARRYKLPFRSSNTTASPTVDEQAVYESSMSLWGAVLAHTNLLVHAAGWIEGGLTASFEKLIIDAEMLQLMSEYLRPIEVSDDTLAFDAIQEVGPGGHFFDSPHTMERYEMAFYSPMLSDWHNYETWEETGSVDTLARANGIWKQLLQEYEQPLLDVAIDEELCAYVARRKESLGRS